MSAELPIGELIKIAIKASGLTQEAAANALGISRQTLNNTLSKAIIEQEFIDEVAEKLNLDLTNVKTKPNGDDLRKKKAFAPSPYIGLIYVPIAAQAGYAMHYEDPVFLRDFPRLDIPGNPFKGDNYRYFQVEGDSMIPTLIDGMQVIAQKIDPDYWSQLQDYYIHVIVTHDRILVKRLFRFDKDTLVMISDNEDLYPQQEIKYSDIKELWAVKRVLDWRMPPPKKFDIKGSKKSDK